MFINIWNQVHSEMLKCVDGDFAEVLFDKFPQFSIGMKYSVMLAAIKNVAVKHEKNLVLNQ